MVTVDDFHVGQEVTIQCYKNGWYPGCKGIVSALPSAGLPLAEDEVFVKDLNNLFADTVFRPADGEVTPWVAKEVPDEEKYAFMTGETLEEVARLLTGLEELDIDKEHVGNLFLTGSLDVNHGDGFRIGRIKSYEDWWVFVPDYQDN